MSPAGKRAARSAASAPESAEGAESAEHREPKPRRRHAPRAGRRRQAREMALQMLYQHELGGSPLPEIFRSYDLHQYGAESSSRKLEKGSPEAFELACKLVSGTLENREEIDRRIVERAENWRIERMPAVDRNILRLAIHEYLSDAELPKVVAIDEAIELAKKFGSEKSGRFVNGLLDSLLSAEPVTATREAGRPAGGREAGRPAAGRGRGSS